MATTDPAAASSRVVTSGRVAAVSGALTVLSLTALVHWAAELGVTVIDSFQHVLKQRSAVEVLERIGAHGREIYLKQIVSFDMCLALSYGVLLFVALRFLRERSGVQARWWLALPLIASAADVIENALIAYLVYSFPDSFARVDLVLGIVTAVKWVALLLALLSVVALCMPHARRILRDYHVGQYVFFVRVPLALGLTLFLLPAFGPSLAPSSLTNLFVTGYLGVAFVTLIGVLLGWVVVYTARLIWVSTAESCGLLFARDETRVPIPEFLLDGYWIWLGPFLALPLVGKLIVAGEGSIPLLGLSAIAGGAVAWTVRRSSIFFSRRAAGLAGTDRALLRILIDVLRWVFISPRVRAPGALLRLHRRAAWFFCVTLWIYLGCGVFTYPGFDYAHGFPTLIYILLLLMLATWVVSHLTFRADVHRVPAVALLIGAAILWQVVWPSGHVYRTHDWSGAAPSTTNAYLRAWWLDRQREGAGGLPMVVVAASGGGITASAWTTEVLTGLERELSGFGESVAAISSVSGGSVGAMYYVEAFEGGALAPGKLERIEEGGYASSLAAVGWGLAYPDLARLALGWTLGRYDRGWSQELRWRGKLGEREAQLSGWSEQVKQFERPLQVFNVTVQETGELWLLAPVLLPRETGFAGDLRDNLGTDGVLRDLPVSTAARLSATFPYVTPHARPTDVPRKRAYHAADGGYYDNSGLAALVHITDDYLLSYDTDATGRPPCIVIVEIRASGLREAELPAERRGQAGSAVRSRRGGLANTISGPVETLYNVRSASQMARNGLEIDQLTRLWKDAGVEIAHHRFVLSGELPLSWHLSDREADDIALHWPGKRDETDDEPRYAEIAEARRYNREQLDALMARWGVHVDGSE